MPWQCKCKFPTAIRCFVLSCNHLCISVFACALCVFMCACVHVCLCVCVSMFYRAHFMLTAERSGTFRYVTTPIGAAVILNAFGSRPGAVTVGLP